MTSPRETKSIKCVVWDLDGTLWSGTLLEGSVSLRPEAKEVIQELDRRGILQSVASKNYHDQAMAQLEAFGLAEFLLCPQINWQAKSRSLQQIAQDLNIALNACAFVDDQPFERAEVAFEHPDVLGIDAEAPLRALLEHPRLKPAFMTSERAQRRIMYQQDFARQTAEETYGGTAEEFLASLEMDLRISEAEPEDLTRVEELIERTSQLNSTGYVYAYEELRAFCHSPTHTLLVAELWDKFGWYGKIGLALIERRETSWVLKLLIVSCRVMTRGIGTTLLGEILRQAHAAGCKLQAEFAPTERNRIMMVTYRFAGFREVGRSDGLIILEHALDRLPTVPDHMTLTVEWPTQATLAPAQ